MLKDLAISFSPFRLNLSRDEMLFGKMGLATLLGALPGGYPQLQLGNGLNCNNLLGRAIIGLRVSVVALRQGIDRRRGLVPRRIWQGWCKSRAKASVIPLFERSHSVGNKAATDRHLLYSI